MVVIILVIAVGLAPERILGWATSIRYQAVFGDIVMHFDGVARTVVIDEDWAITTRIDTGTYQDTVWKAIFCHISQLPSYSALEQVPEQYRQAIWSEQYYYRAFSLVNGGRAVERDLFEGLR